MEPRIPLNFWLPSTHCWPTSNFSCTSIPKSWSSDIRSPVAFLALCSYHTQKLNKEYPGAWVFFPQNFQLSSFLSNAKVSSRCSDHSGRVWKFRMWIKNKQIFSLALKAWLMTSYPLAETVVASLTLCISLELHFAISWNSKPCQGKWWLSHTYTCSA